MDESDKLVLEIIETFYSDWLECQKKRYPNLSEYEKYKHIILDTFGYDIDRIVIEQERGIDFTELERKLKIMKLSKELREKQKTKKQGKEKEKK